MDFLLPFTTVIATILACVLLFNVLKKLRVVERKKGESKTVPLAAGSWPIIGHLHLLAGHLPHRVLGSMADKFGPIFMMNLGVHQTIVVSNAEMARECLTTNDKVFASRPKAMVAKPLGYNYANFALAPYGSYWREVRKIMSLELVSDNRVRVLSNTRVSEVKLTIKETYQTWMANKGSSKVVAVEMRQWFFNFTLNLIVQMLCGKRLSVGDEEADRFKTALRRFTELLGAFVPSDAHPWLRWLDSGGYQEKMKMNQKEIDDILQGWLDEHRTKKGGDQFFMGALLARIKGESGETLQGFDIDTIVKATSLSILSAASDTTAVTLTWALALLLNNPLALKKAQEELQIQVGRDRQVEESDLKNLVYLQAILKETMRLYPAAPLSVPHESTEDCVVAGYDVPKGTRLLLNLYKIQRDPQIWDEPDEFRPERFLTTHKDIDVRGQHFELIPFSSGRRMCPGITFSLHSMPFILASLIHGFELKNPSAEPVDMSESTGLANLKATPFEVLCSPRLSPNLYD